MERNFKRISEELKLPRESRERIRSQIASYQGQQEEISMKKANLKRRIPLLVAAVIAAMALTLTAGAAVARLFRNDVIVSSVSDIPAPSNEGGAPASVGIVGPIGNAPSPLEKIIEGDRWKSDDWQAGEKLDGGIIMEYSHWDAAEVLSSDPALRSRRVSRADGAEKMEYTAENPANLLSTLTGRVTADLTWMHEHYDYVPDANQSFVVTDEDGDYVSEALEALYAKPDGGGYVRVSLRNTAEADYYAQSYVIDGSYETAYYHATPGGYEFLIEMDNGNVWAQCRTSHARVSLFGAYLSAEEVENILDNLSLSISEQ